MGGDPPRPIAIVGPTAAAKSALAIELAETLGDTEIVSADSMALYRGMDIGTATPTPDERARVAHHGLDLAEPTETFTVASYAKAATAAIETIEARGHRVLVVGGTGLYVRAVVDDLDIPGQYPAIRAELEAEADAAAERAPAGAGDDTTSDPGSAALHRRLADLDPVAAGRMDPANRRRVIRALEVTLGSGRRFSDHGPGLSHHPPTRYRLLGLWPSLPEIDQRITGRYRAQLADGLLDEVDALAALGDRLSPTAAQALGYRELLVHRAGELTLDAAIDEAEVRTRRFARRQRRWFRRDPRITWIGADDRVLALRTLHRLATGVHDDPRGPGEPVDIAG